MADTRAVILAFVCLLPYTGSVKVFPSGEVIVQNGLNLYVKMVDLIPDLKTCSVQVNEEPPIDLTDAKISSDEQFRYWGQGFSKYECGVEVKEIQKSQAGKWKLIASNGTLPNISGELEVKVIEPLAFNVPEVVLNLGETRTVTFGPKDAKFCNVKSPDGRTYFTTVGCEVQIKVATKLDNGEWNVEYSLAGSTRTFAAVVNVSVKDTPLTKTIITSVSPSITANGGLNILCKAPESNLNLQYCLFTRPDGEQITVYDGLGDGKYSYYGAGMKAKECGLTILQPYELDYGRWKCIFLYETEMKGSFITVKHSNGQDTTQELLASADNPFVTVTNGSNIETVLKCRVNEVLTACWFTHPNGSHIIVRPGSSAKYAGAGLELGECGIALSNLQLKDKGKWSCNMAVAGSSKGDFKVPIDLNVYTTAVFSPGGFQAAVGQSAKVGCVSLIPNRPMAYCRFVRPDGQGITFTDQEQKWDRYSYTGLGISSGECGVEISHVKNVDFGKWSCIGLFKHKNSEDAVEVNLSPRELQIGSISAWTIGIAGILALLGGIAYWRIRRQRSQYNSTISHFSEISATDRMSTSESVGGESNA